MIGVFNTIRINNTEILMPNDFTVTRSPIYEGEYTSCTGKTFADLVGWKYADMTLEWDYLPDSMLQSVIALSGENTITFEDADGTHTETFIPTSSVTIRGRQTLDDGGVLWHDVRLAISFIGAHQ